MRSGRFSQKNALPPPLGLPSGGPDRPLPASLQSRFAGFSRFSAARPSDRAAEKRKTGEQGVGKVGVSSCQSFAPLAESPAGATETNLDASHVARVTVTSG